MPQQSTPVPPTSLIMNPPTNQARSEIETAIREFKAALSNNELYNKILETKTVDQVYDALEDLQEKQAANNALGHLAKVSPYLDRLREYSGVLDTFAQVEPDILCLLWGPIKLLLQFASVLKQSFDDIVNTIEEIGEPLSELHVFVKLFPDKECIPRILALIFQDLLDFYSIALEFFKGSHWKLMYEALWPKKRAKIRVAVSNLERHCSQLRNRVQLEHLHDEANARTRAFEHFEKSEKANQRAEYRRIRESFSPKEYYADLERLGSLVCKGTDHWLEKDEDFLGWLQPSQTTGQIIWLQGIPGAGKTFLSSMVVRRALSVAPTLFAFLSHKLSTSTTARSITHSLLFQLCDNIEDLQEILCEEETQKLKLDLTAIVSVFGKLLRISGPVFVVIDGLDEIDGIERTRLLRCLLEISADCEAMRLLISSRIEADIGGILKARSTPIRVDNRNLGGIQSYVSNHLNVWFDDRNFIPTAQAEITKLLDPLAYKASGMFMYARVVLSTVEDIDDIESIRESLQVLPEDLDDAYNRIRKRIDLLKPKTRVDKARRLLGWVGCSPCPMTKQELEAALTIRAGDFDGCKGVIAETTAIRDCGPLIEVVDDYVQFAHFTVKEYIFSSHIPNNPVSLVESSFLLTNCCIQYLCQRHHDETLSDDEFGNLLQLGVFRLHDYASLMWLKLVEQCCRFSDAVPRSDQSELLQRLQATRSNQHFRQQKESSTSVILMFNPFKPDTDVYNLLNRAAAFERKCSEGEFDRRKAAPWIGLDPLTMTTTSTRLIPAVDQLLCGTVSHRKGCRCSEVQWHFGPRPFKCNFFGCFYTRHGFGKKGLRNSHQNYHDRPWNCTEAACQFSQGFLSRKMRDQHWELCHRECIIPPEIPANIPGDERVPLLTDLIRANNAELFSLVALQDLDDDELRQISKMVGRFGSIPVAQVYLAHFKQIKKTRMTDTDLMIRAAINAGNIDIFHYCMFDSTCGIMIAFSDVLGSIFKSSVEAFRDNWEQLVDEESQRRAAGQLTQGIQLIPFGHRFTALDILGASTARPENVVLLRQIWDRIDLAGTMTTAYLGKGLLNIAATCCSVELATYFLDAGVPVDYRKGDTFLTPLHHATRHDTAVAANFIRFLLEQGADPYAFSGSDTSSIRRINDEKGAQNISNWLGMTWDELVEATKAIREGKRVV